MSKQKEKSKKFIAQKKNNEKKRCNDTTYNKHKHAHCHHHHQTLKAACINLEKKNNN